jgi:hypothetical protein
MFSGYVPFKSTFMLGSVGTVRAVEGYGVRGVLGVDVTFYIPDVEGLVGASKAGVNPPP